MQQELFLKISIDVKTSKKTQTLLIRMSNSLVLHVLQKGRCVEFKLPGMAAHNMPHKFQIQHYYQKTSCVHKGGNGGGESC